MSCAPDWYVLGQECPYGHKLVLDVTVPNDADFWQMSSITYGLIPWILCLALALLFLIYRGTRELSVALLPAITVGVNELIKRCVQQPRPIGSCLTTCGMPSSHSAVSMCLLVYLILDAAYRLDANGSRPTSLLPPISAIKEFLLKLGKGLVLLPFGSMSQNEFSVYLTIWIPALIPVPISRVLLNDHSASQVLAGCIVGFVTGFLWFPIVLALRLKMEKVVGRKFLYIFVHNYDVPQGWKEIPVCDASKDPLVPVVDDTTQLSA